MSRVCTGTGSAQIDLRDFTALILVTGMWVICNKLVEYNASLVAGLAIGFAIV